MAGPDLFSLVCFGTISVLGIASVLFYAWAEGDFERWPEFADYISKWQ